MLSEKYQEDSYYSNPAWYYFNLHFLWFTSYLAICIKLHILNHEEDKVE